MNKTIDSSYTGEKYGNIFKEINEDQIIIPSKMIDKIILNLPSKLMNSKILFINMAIIYYLKL